MLRSRRWPLAFLAVVLVLPPLGMVVALPGEKQLKNLVGIDTSEGCGPIRNVGPEAAWREEPEAEVLREGPATAVVDGRIYLAGGIRAFNEDFTVAHSSAEVEVFDPRTGRWDRLPPMPRALNHVQFAAVGSSLYVFGGLTEEFSRFAASGESWRFDLRTRSWSRLPEMPSPRGGGATAVMGDRVYVIGGRNGRASLPTVESFDVAEGIWRVHTDMPTRRDHHAVAVHAGRLYAAGGRQEDLEGLRTLEIYHPERDVWAEGPAMPEPKSGFGMEVTPAGLVVAGGEDLSRWTLYGGVYAYEPDGRSWRALPAMARPRHGHGQAYVDGRLYVIGGSRCSGFKPEPGTWSMGIA